MLLFPSAQLLMSFSFPEHIIKDKLKEREREKDREREKEKKKDRDKDKDKDQEKDKEKKKHKLMNEFKRENGEVKLLQKGEWCSLYSSFNKQQWYCSMTWTIIVRSPASVFNCKIEKMILTSVV